MGERTIRTWRSTSNKTTAYYANSSNAGGSDDDYRKLREAVYLLRRRLGEGDAQDVVWNDGNGSGEGNSDGDNDVREVVEQDGACIFAHSRLHCDCRAEYYIESYCANPECSEVHEQCYCARHFAYKIGKYINLLERSRVDAARLRDEVLWAGLLPSCMTLLDWGRLN